MMKKALLAAAAVLACAGATTTSASALGLTPNPYAFEGTQTEPNLFSLAETSAACDSVQVSGSTANSTAESFTFRPALDCCSFALLGFPFGVDVTVNSDWRVTYGEGDHNDWPGLPGQPELTSPGGGAPAIEMSVPAIGCQIKVYSQDGLEGLTLKNDEEVGGLYLDPAIADVTYATQGLCPGMPAVGSDLQWVGGIVIPGVTLND